MRAQPLERATLVAAMTVAHEYLTEREDRLARRIVADYAELRRRSSRRRR